MHVLHITNWYPNVIQPGETPFIRRHVEALAPHCTNEVWHIEVRQATPARTIRQSLAADRTFIRVSPQQRWRIIEWMTTGLVLWMWWTRDRSRRFDIVNFHVAYPLATHLRLLRLFIRSPMVITEHWTAYRFDFHTRSAGLERIRRIFGHGVPLICVSHTLAGDIERFAKRGPLPIAVVDNVVDTQIFHHDPSIVPEPGRFFAIASWRAMKRSDVMIRTIGMLRARGVDARLRMAGGGKGLDAIREIIAKEGLQEHITLLGQLDAAQVADEMRRAHILLHASDYETYSVVCAESLCCGTPVVVSDLEAINEYLRPEMGRTVQGHDTTVWADAIMAFWDQALNADRPLIARRMATRADARDVGLRYHAILKAVHEQGGTLPAHLSR